MMKRLLVFIVAIMGYVGAWAYSFMANGIKYDIISANEVSVASDNTLSGNITIPSQVTYNSVLYQVTSIGDDAFYNCSLTSVTIPNSVTSIGEWAFWECSSLTSVTIGNSVTSIGEWAFGDCRGLTSVTIPSSVTSIGSNAFDGCRGLTSVTVRVLDYSAFLTNGVCNLLRQTFVNDKPVVLIDGSGNEIKNFIIPSGITTIGLNAFLCCSGLTSVTIPNNVTSIGQGAFYGCSGLTSVTIPNNVTSIGHFAFQNCNGLTSVTIGNSVTSIGDKAFYGCSGLTSVTIPNSVTSIGERTFQNCSGLTSVTIGNSVTSIGVSAFDGTAWYYNQPEGLLYIGRVAYKYKGTMPANTSIAIKDGTVSISGYAFYNCSGLTSVTIPNSVTSIGGSAFYNCSGLTSVTIGNSVTSIGDYAFAGTAWYDNQPDGLLYIGRVAYNYKGTMPDNTSIVIKDGTVSISASAFYGCSGLTSVTIPNSVTSIGWSAFYGCSGLTSVTIPNSVTSIGDYAFEYCSGLTSVTIPSSVTSIGKRAFEGCSGLTSVTVRVLDYSAFLTNGLFNLLRCADVVLIDESGNEIKNYVIPNDITAIGDAAFYNCSGLTSVTIPSSVTSIGSNAFDGCRGLTSVTVRVLDYSAFLTNGVCNLLRSAFVNDKPVVLIDGSGNEIKNFIIPSGITTIGLNAFLCCSGLTSVTIPNNVTSIGQGAFYGCSGLTSVDIPNSVTTIGNYAFQKCSGLTSLTIPNSVTSIGISPFSGCSGLTSVTFHCQNVGTWFKGFTSIKEVHIGNEVSSVESDAFSGCSNLTAVHISDLAAWCGIGFENAYGNPLSAGGHLFLNSQEVTDLIIPSSVTTIKFAAFYGCKGLTSVTIPSNVESIKKSAFCSCSNLTSAVIGNSVTSIGDYAFYECSGLTSLTIPSSVTAIGDKAFYQNNYSVISALTSVKVAVANRSAFVNNNVGNLVKTAIGKPVVLIDESGNEIKDYTIPDVITAIGDNAFYNCSGLTSVVIPNSVTSIGDYAFSNCSGLSEITVNAENPAYDSRNGCNAIIETASGTLIAGCMNTVIPEGVTAIADYAFYGSTLLPSIDIPEGVTSIGNRAFYNCNWLASVTIPSSVTSIGDYAFSGCAHLTAVTVGLTAPITINSNVFSNRANATLYVPIGSKTAFMLADVWNGFKEVVEVKIQAGQTLDLTELPVMTVGNEPYVLPATTTEGQPLTWTIDDGTVASIDGSVLTPLRAGTAIVTATQEGNDDYKPFSREFSLTVEGVAGDLNNDGGVNIADIVLIIDVMSGENNDASMRQIADITGDGDVNIADIIAAIDLMIAQTGGSSPNNAPARMATMERNGDYITARMDGDVMSIGLNNVNDYTAFQMTVTLPEGASISDIVLDEGRCGKHVAAVSQLNDRQYLVTAYSLSNKRLNGSAGKLFSLHTERLNGEATISDVIFATPEAKPCLLDGATVMGTATGIGGIDSQSADSNVYDLQGRHISGNGQSTMVNAPMKKGVYIVNGKKVVKK